MRKGQYGKLRLTVMRMLDEHKEVEEIARELNMPAWRIRMVVKEIRAAEGEKPTIEVEKVATQSRQQQKHEEAGRKGATLAAAATCEKCPHREVCKYLDDRRRIYDSLSHAAGQLPPGLSVEYKVRCKYGEEAAAETGKKAGEA